jgi:hypothetical protein
MGGCLNRFPGSFYVLAPATRQGSNDGPPYLARHRLNGTEVSLGRYGEARLDDVNAQLFKLLRHPELFRRCHAATWRLFPIP